MDTIIRFYRDSDYEYCESLVNKAWSFDEIFQPVELATLAKYLYTKGALVSSNYQRVVEHDGKVIGFIFGYDNLARKPKGKLLFGLEILWKLNRVKCHASESKKKLVDAIGEHQKNRFAIVGRGRSEIVLFVIAKSYQRKGIGQLLWSDFRSYCEADGVETVIVETNKLGASSFYEKLGFRLVADFDSPLHELATKGGQAQMYEFSLN
jgi:ribosomal protein S18 acetylase RimI-like enzyme